MNNNYLIIGCEHKPIDMPLLSETKVKAFVKDSPFVVNMNYPVIEVKDEVSAVLLAQKLYNEFKDQNITINRIYGELSNPCILFKEKTTEQ